MHFWQVAHNTMQYCGCTCSDCHLPKLELFGDDDFLLNFPIASTLRVTSVSVFCPLAVFVYVCVTLDNNM